MARPRNLTPLQEEALIALYKDVNVSTQEIADRFGISDSGVRWYAVRHNLPARHKGPKVGQGRGIEKKKRRYSLDHAVFEQLETSPVASYFLGLMLTDGHVGRGQSKQEAKGSYNVSFSQSERRKDVVYKFQDFLKTDRPVYVQEEQGNNTRVYSLTVASKRIYETLVEYGVVPNKTGIQTVDPRVKRSRDFWRGVFDGDGYIAHKREDYLTLAVDNTSPRLMEEMADYWRSIVGSHSVSYLDRHLPSGAAQWRVVANSVAAYRLADHLYRDACVYSESKYAVYASCFDRFGDFGGG